MIKSKVKVDYTRKVPVDRLLDMAKKNILIFSDEQDVVDPSLAAIAVSFILMDFSIDNPIALEDSNGKYKVIFNGKIIASLLAYINGEFPLPKIDLVEDLSGLYFNKLNNLYDNTLLSKNINIDIVQSYNLKEDDLKTVINLKNLLKNF